MALAKADFYYGALLSQLVNSGFAPAIIERGDTRRIYSFSNDFSDFKVYAKYVAKPASNESESKRWDFSFNPEEVNTILEDTTINMFAFICGVRNFKGSEICFLSKEQLYECFGKYFTSPNRRVTVLLDKKGSRNFTVYGTGLDRRENALKIIRNVNKRLQEFMEVPNLELMLEKK